MPSKHINAQPGDIADTIIMPGDPLRAKHIAEKFLTDVNQVNDVRNMLGFTGYYKNIPISIMGHGMGIPSISIYVKELISEFGVKKIIRTGTCGVINPSVKLRDIVVAMGASTNSAVNRIRFKGYDYAAIADYDLLNSVVISAKEKGLNVQVGNIFTSDLFYNPDQEIFDILRQYNILAMEMETAGLYSLAASLGAKAVTLCAVSDNSYTSEALSSHERQTGFDGMVEVALSAAILGKS